MKIVIGNGYTIEGLLEVDTKAKKITIHVNLDGNPPAEDIENVFSEASDMNTGFIYTIEDGDITGRYYGYIITEDVSSTDNELTVVLRRGTTDECIDHLYKLCHSAMFVTNDSLECVNASVVQNDRLMQKSIMSIING